MFANTSNKEKIALIVAASLSVVGIAAWIYQLTQGLQVTGLDNTVIWGLTIAVFFAIIAGGAGLLTLCGLSEYLGFMNDVQRKQGITFALAALVAGGVLVVMDLGNPGKFLYLVGSFNLTSFTVLDFWFLTFTMIAAVVYLFMARAGKLTKVVGTVTAVLAVGLVVVEGVLLANNTSHHLWASPMSVVSFLAGAFLAGSALLAVIAPETKRVFMIALLTSALVTFAEVGTSLVAGTDLARGTMQAVVAGPFSPYFYFQIVIGLAVPFALLLKTNRVALASLCGVLGLAAEKLWLLCAGEAEIWVQMHHIGPLQASQQFFYVPSFVEIAITAGAIGMGVFLFLLIKNMLFKVGGQPVGTAGAVRD